MTLDNGSILTKAAKGEVTDCGFKLWVTCSSGTRAQIRGLEDFKFAGSLKPQEITWLEQCTWQPWGLHILSCRPYHSYSNVYLSNSETIDC